MMFFLKITALALVGYLAVATTNALTDYRELDTAERHFDQAAAQLAQEREDDGVVAANTQSRFRTTSEECERAFEHVERRWRLLML